MKAWLRTLWVSQCLLGGCAVDDLVAAIRNEACEGCNMPEPQLPCASVPAYSSTVAAAFARLPVCACDEMSLGASLASGVAMGTDGDVSASGALEGSSLTVGGSVQIGADDARFGGSLLVGSRWRGEGPLSVGGDAGFGRAVRASSLQVGGTLAAPSEDDVDVPLDQLGFGTFLASAPTVEPPCACDMLPSFEALLPSVSASVAVDLEVVDGDLELGLGCGVHALGQIRGSGAARIRVSGTVVLVVDRVAVDRLELEIPVGGELRLFVAEDVLVPDGWSVEGGGRLRMIVGGRGTLRLPSDVSLDADLFAPEVELVVPGAARWSGALWVDRIASSGPLELSE